MKGLASRLRSVLNSVALTSNVVDSVLLVLWAIDFDVMSRLLLFVFHEMAFYLICQMPVDDIDVFRIDVAFWGLAVRGLFCDETEHFAVSDM